MSDYMTPQIIVLLLVGMLLSGLSMLYQLSSVGAMIGGAGVGAVVVAIFVLGPKAIYLRFTSDEARRRWLTWGPTAVGLFFMIGVFLQDPSSSSGAMAGLFATAVFGFPARWVWLYASSSDDSE